MAAGRDRSWSASQLTSLPFEISAVSPSGSSEEIAHEPARGSALSACELTAWAAEAGGATERREPRHTLGRQRRTPGPCPPARPICGLVRSVWHARAGATPGGAGAGPPRRASWGIDGCDPTAHWHERECPAAAPREGRPGPGTVAATPDRLAAGATTCSSNEYVLTGDVGVPTHHGEVGGFLPSDTPRYVSVSPQRWEGSISPPERRGGAVPSLLARVLASGLALTRSRFDFAADVTDDGCDDLLTIPPTGDASIAIAHRASVTESTLVDERIWSVVGSTPRPSPAVCSLGDLDGDGRADLVQLANDGPGNVTAHGAREF